MTEDHHARWIERFAGRVTHWAGSTMAFAAALGIIIAWGLTGPYFGYSEVWQLVINTGTTIVTFLMVFLIQRTQNKDSRAVHLKLNELLAALQGASNRLICIEEFSEAEIGILNAHYRRLVERAKLDKSLTESHSIEEADERHQDKLEADA